MNENQNVALVQGYSYQPSLGLDKMKAVAEEIIESGLCPSNLNQVGQLIAVAEMGRAVGVDWITAINNIDNIQGRPTLSYRLVGALLNKAGFRVRLIRDYEGVYDTNGNMIDIVTEMELIDLNMMETLQKELFKLKDLPEDLRKPATAMLDHYPSMVKRNFKFTWNQATQAKLMEKTNYIVRPIEMFRARCLTGMVRLYCPQILMGFYETSELHDVVPETTGMDSYTTVEVMAN